MIDQSNGQVRDEQQQSRPFNPNEHIMQIKSGQTSKDYLPVQWRLVWFRSAFPQGTIETEMLHIELDRETEEEVFVWNNEKRRSEKAIKRANGFVIFKAIVKDGIGGVATGTKSEKAASFADYVEKAETGAIGRALAALGYGTQFAPELDEAHRIVDSPVERSGVGFNGNGQSNSSVPAASVQQNGHAQNGAGSNGYAQNGARASEDGVDAGATEQQLASIRKLCAHMGKSEPDNVTSISNLGAKKLLQQLSAEYKEYKQSTKAS